MNVRTNMKSGAACYTVQSGDSLCKISQKFYGSCTDANNARFITQTRPRLAATPARFTGSETIYPRLKVNSPASAREGLEDLLGKTIFELAIV
jgi:hypothetical protein